MAEIKIVLPLGGVPRYQPQRVVGVGCGAEGARSIEALPGREVVHQQQGAPLGRARGERLLYQIAMQQHDLTRFQRKFSAGKGLNLGFWSAQRLRRPIAGLVLMQEGSEHALARAHA